MYLPYLVEGCPVSRSRISRELRERGLRLRRSDSREHGLRFASASIRRDDLGGYRISISERDAARDGLDPEAIVEELVSIGFVRSDLAGGIYLRTPHRSLYGDEYTGIFSGGPRYERRIWDPSF